MFSLVVSSACAWGCATPRAVAPPPARETMAAAPEDAVDGVWMDCRADDDCALHRPGTVCHAAVLGGTCAPPCDDDAACAVLGEGGRCVEGRCGRAP